MKFSNPDMLVYIGMADAYAAAAEYLQPQEFDPILQECLTFKKYVPHPRFGTGRGRYTDDTEMSVANARVLIKDNEPFTPLMFAHQYVSEFERGGRRKGYSKNFQQFLEGILSGEDFLMKIRPHSVQNGAAMRAVPIGVLPTRERVIATAEMQAKITHDTPDGTFSAKLVALMSHYSLYEPGPLSELREYCLTYMSDWEHELYDWLIRNRWSGFAVEATKRYSVAANTVAAVLDLVVHQSSLMEILKQTLVWGGDTDSVAAIAWGIASARYQEEHLPRFMWTDLETDHPSTNTEYLRHLGTMLMNRYAR